MRYLEPRGPGPGPGGGWNNCGAACVGHLSSIMAPNAVSPAHDGASFPGRRSGAVTWGCCHVVAGRAQVISLSVDTGCRRRLRVICACPDLWLSNGLVAQVPGGGPSRQRLMVFPAGTPQWRTCSPCLCTSRLTGSMNTGTPWMWMTTALSTWGLLAPGTCVLS